MRCDPDMVEDLMKSIVLTGGGSSMRYVTQYISGQLKERGYDVAVQKVDDYKQLVARGAVKMADKVRPEQWSIPM